jgi:hypothetical protein
VAALELLRDRAASEAVWPEFSEYDCFSCHHALADERWRRRRPGDGSTARPAILRWGSWYLPMTRTLAGVDRLADGNSEGDWEQFEAALDPLITTMGRPIPDREAARRRADEAIGPLARRVGELSSRSFRPAEIERFLAALNDPQTWEGVDSWDGATQRYLSLVAFHQARLRSSPDRVTDLRQLDQQLGELRERLKFDEGYAGPRGFDPTKVRGGR